MNPTTQKRRPISIYDYPEHLNPFSECHLNFQVPEKRSKIIVDKLRKNGTWSSKITKKLNRSVSWIEKSWLPVDNSPRKDYESRICNDLHNNALYAKQSQVHNIPVTRRESCSDVRHEVESTPSEFISNDTSLEKSKSVENLNKCDTRRRKKRPAPLPPNATRSPSVTERPIVEESDQEIKVTIGECKMEEKSQHEVSISHHDEKKDTVPIDRETEPTDELPSEENLQNVPCDESSTKIDESKLTDQIENLRIDNEDKEQSKENTPTCCQLDVAQVESNENQENIAQLHLDENENISSVKNENEDATITSVKIENEITIEKNNSKVTLLPTENEIRNP